MQTLHFFFLILDRKRVNNLQKKAETDQYDNQNGTQVRSLDA